MTRVHPDQDDNHFCSVCGYQICLYPSGQAVLAANPAATLVCQVCGFEPGRFDKFIPSAQTQEIFDRELRESVEAPRRKPQR